MQRRQVQTPQPTRHLSRRSLPQHLRQRAWCRLPQHLRCLVPPRALCLRNTHLLPPQTRRFELSCALARIDRDRLIAVVGVIFGRVVEAALEQEVRATEGGAGRVIAGRTIAGATQRGTMEDGAGRMIGGRRIAGATQGGRMEDGAGLMIGGAEPGRTIARKHRRMCGTIACRCGVSTGPLE